MRYLAVALALAFAVGARVAQANCPNMKHASTQVASTDSQPAPQSTKVKIPAQPGG